MSLEPPRRACEMMLWFILFFAPAAFGATEWWSRAVLESLIFILAAMCALRRDFYSPFNASLIGFGVIIALGVLQLLQQRPLTEPAGLLPFTLSRPQTLYALLFWAALATLFWSASGIMRWEGARRRLFWAILGIGLFIAVIGILQRGQGNTAYYGLRLIRHGRPFGPFTNYDHAATWMIASAFIGMGLFTASFHSDRHMPLPNRVAKQSLIAFVLLVLIAGILETGSRGGLNALLASALVTVGLASRSLTRVWARRLTRAGLVLAGGAYVLFLYTHPKWLGFANGELDQSAAYRVSMYRSGLRMFGDSPIFGWGLGGFANAFRPYQEPMLVGLVDHVHGSWLEIVLETGLLGIAAFGVAVLKPLAALGRRIAHVDFPLRAVSAGCFAALLAFILHGLVDFSFQIPANTILLVALLAATSVLTRKSLESSRTVERTPRAALSGGFLVLAFLSLWPGFSGLVPRLGAPFESPGDALLVRRVTYSKIDRRRHIVNLLYGNTWHPPGALVLPVSSYNMKHEWHSANFVSISATTAPA